MKADSPLVTAVSPSPNFGDRQGRGIDALILHYTGMSTGEAARARLLDAASEVSCHYLVWEDGRIEQLVAETDRAWHAGRSSWKGETDMNTVSIGIEIVNCGHDGGCPPYPAPQIEALIALALDIGTRHAIPACRVLAHSDVAPARKCDPGEWFPWKALAASGVGLWVETLGTTSPDLATGDKSLGLGSSGADVHALQKALATFGYDCPVTGIFDDVTADVVAAFQRHYRAERVDGRADAATRTALDTLNGLRP